MYNPNRQTPLFLPIFNSNKKKRMQKKTKDGDKIFYYGSCFYFLECPSEFCRATASLFSFFFCFCVVFFCRLVFLFWSSQFYHFCHLISHGLRQVMDEGGNTNDLSTGSGTDDRRIATWSALATHMTPSIQRVVEFAKRVPGNRLITARLFLH